MMLDVLALAVPMLGRRRDHSSGVHTGGISTRIDCEKLEGRMADVRPQAARYRPRF